MVALLATFLYIATDQPLDTERAFHEALRTGTRESVLRLLDPYLTVVENGVIETLQQYAQNHLEADMEFARATKREMQNESQHMDHDGAWVITIGQVHGDFHGKPVHDAVIETMTLVRKPEGWRIKHIHWSSRDAPAAPTTAANRGRHCDRVSKTCWQCADIDLPAEAPCPRPTGCNGACINGNQCVPSTKVCCPDAASCSRPPGCDAASSCGDLDSDGANDYCTFLSPCAKDAPPKRALSSCAPPPALKQFASYAKGAPQAQCKPTPLTYEINAEEMRSGASDDTGPGLCYGIISFDAAGNSIHGDCQAYHCETLRYCDGREHARYCTIMARCDKGVVRAVGFTW